VVEAERTIARESRGPVVVLRFERGKVNALDLELMTALEEELVALEQDETVRAVVLTGTGSSFSAGVDLFRVLAGGEEYVREFVPSVTTGFRRLFAFPKPVVAAINGHAIAGGCVIALASDHRIMAEGAGRIGVPELLVGVSWPAHALEIVRFALPPFRAQELVYSGRTVGAEEARGLGLVDEIVDPESLLDAALEAAERLAHIPAEAFRLAKRQLRGPTLELADRVSREKDEEVARFWASQETAEAIRSYLDRTVGRAR
jgi:enoyl-CoA hydratase